MSESESLSSTSAIALSSSSNKFSIEGYRLFPNNLRGRIRLIVGLALLTLLAGVRFSDGSLLLAIAKGEDVTSPAFRDPLTQYHWDQPLKIALLRNLPPSIIVIAGVFLALSLLPACFALYPNGRLFWLVTTTLLLTPAFKIVLQNVGAGDGLVIALVVVAASFPIVPVVATCFFLIGIWHPQQAFFIGLSGLLANCLYREQPDRRLLAVTCGSLALALIVYLGHKSSLDFEFSGRASFVSSHLQNYFVRNLVFAPIALSPIALWFILVAPSPRRGRFLLVFWLIILATVSLIATDVTRVLTIVSLPLVLAGASVLYENSKETQVVKPMFLTLMLLVAIIPVYSWSGLDIFLWGDLKSDLCKWGIICP